MCDVQVCACVMFKSVRVSLTVSLTEFCFKERHFSVRNNENFLVVFCDQEAPFKIFTMCHVLFWNGKLSGVINNQSKK